MNCSKCKIIETQNNFKESRTVCKLCYNNHVLTYYKNRFCPNSSPQSDGSDQKGFFSNKHDISNKQDGSNKQDSSNKQESSNKQDS